MPGKNLELANEFAKEYDSSILDNNWNGPEIIFTEVKKYLKPGAKILDLGIGTGESAFRFQNKGCQITGIDGSPGMLEQCKKKSIGSKLILHDLEVQPYPLNDNEMDFIISNGLFHLINPLEGIFYELRRILKHKGLLIFTYDSADDNSGYQKQNWGVWKRNSPSGVITYKYTHELIYKVLTNNGFNILSARTFLAFTNPSDKKNIYFTAILARLL